MKGEGNGSPFFSSELTKPSTDSNFDLKFSFAVYGGHGYPIEIPDKAQPRRNRMAHGLTFAPVSKDSSRKDHSQDFSSEPAPCPDGGADAIPR